MSFYSNIIGDAADVANIQHAAAPGSPDFTATNVTTLNSALASASAGNVIVVQDGSYGSWSPTKNNTGAKIRIIAQSVHGATFSTIAPENLHGVTLENLKADSINFNTGGNSGDCIVQGGLFVSTRITNLDGPIYFNHSVFDRNYNGICVSGSGVGGALFFTRCIFARGGTATVSGSEDNIKVQGFTRFEMDNSVIWGNITTLSGAHPDLLQLNGGFTGFGAGPVRIRKCLLYGGVDGSGGRVRAQGVFLSDAQFSDVIIEDNLICQNGLTRRLSVNSATGSGNIIRRNSLMGLIHGENKNGTGDNSGVTVTDNLCKSVSDEVGGGWLLKSGNTEMGENPSTNYMTNASGDGRSWRDYVAPAGGPGVGKGAAAFIAEIESGLIPDPIQTLPATVTIAFN